MLLCIYIILKSIIMPQPNSNPLIELNESLQFKPKTEEYRDLIDLRHRENLDKLKPQIKTIKDALASKGLNNTAIAGVIGSLYQESKLNPAIHQAGGKGYGLPQYTKGSERYKNLINSAKQNKSNINDLTFQANHLAEEMFSNDSSILSNAWLGEKNRQSFLKSDSPSQATVTFTEKFLRPGKPDMQQRVYFANYINHILKDIK